MTRELKLSLILGFSLVLVVTVLIGDHLSKARTSSLDASSPVVPVAILPPASEDLLPRTPPTDRTVASSGLSGPESRSSPSGGPPSGMVQPARFEAPAGESHVVTIIEQGGLSSASGAGPRARTADNQTDGQASSTPSADRTHTVVTGDTLFGISRRYYRDGKYHRQLAMYNNFKPDASLRVGAVIRVPEIDVLTGRSARPSAAPRQPLYAGGGSGSGLEAGDGSDSRLASNAGVRRGGLEPLINLPGNKSGGGAEAKAVGASYTVKKGDTLGHIAARELGSARRASEILALNSGVVPDEFGLKVGMVIKLPSK